MRESIPCLMTTCLALVSRFFSLIHMEEVYPPNVFFSLLFLDVPDTLYFRTAVPFAKLLP